MNWTHIRYTQRHSCGCCKQKHVVKTWGEKITNLTGVKYDKSCLHHHFYHCSLAMYSNVDCYLTIWGISHHNDLTVADIKGINNALFKHDTSSLTEVNRRQPRTQKISLNLLKTMLYSSLGNQLITSSSFRVLQSCLQVTITFCKRSQCPLEKSATKSVQLLVHLWKQSLHNNLLCRDPHIIHTFNLSSFSLFPSPSSHNPPDVQ